VGLTTTSLRTRRNQNNPACPVVTLKIFCRLLFFAGVQSLHEVTPPGLESFTAILRMGYVHTPMDGVGGRTLLL